MKYIFYRLKMKRKPKAKKSLLNIVEDFVSLTLRVKHPII